MIKIIFLCLLLYRICSYLCGSTKRYYRWGNTSEKYLED